MNDTNLSAVLVEIVRDVKYGVEQQWPEVAQQALQYDFTAALIWFLICSSVLCGFAVTCHVAIKKAKAERGYVILSVIAGIVAIVFVFITPCHVVTMVKIKSAPKLYLLDRFIKR